MKNAQLKALFEALEFTNVETFIASGNVIFDAPSAGRRDALERAIAKHLHASLGYAVATFLRTLDEVCAISQHKPFGNGGMADGESLIVGFVGAPLDEGQQKLLMSIKPARDEFAMDGANLYWLCRTRQSDSEFSNAKFEKLTRVQATFRNMTTVRKIAIKYSSRQD